MRLTVLGSSASYAGPGQARSGHLVEAGDVKIMADCGNGSLANLARVLDPITLDSVFITHMHADHFLDLYSLQAMLRFAPQGPTGALPLHLPDGLFERMGCLLSDRGRQELRDAFEVEPLADGVPVEFSGLTVTPMSVVHDGPSFALVFDDGNGRICYTSDTEAGDAVLRAAQGADVVVAEATLPEGYAGMVPHMTAREAAALAGQAGASTLVLTHLWPTTPRQEILEEASHVFDGEIVVAEELAVVEV
jgi:ribonuclease BN (tRNA processing enzyme)